MFGNDESQDGPEKTDPSDDLFGSEASSKLETDRPLADADLFGEAESDRDLMDWGALPNETRSELEQTADNPMCGHDEDREVVTVQSGTGVSVAGTGANATRTVIKIVCPTCGGEWDTQDGDNETTGRNRLDF